MNKDKKWYIEIGIIIGVLFILAIAISVVVKTNTTIHASSNNNEETDANDTIDESSIEDLEEDYSVVDDEDNEIDVDEENEELTFDENLIAEKIVTDNLGCSKNGQNNGVCIKCSGSSCNNKKYICYCCSDGYIYDGGNICVKR